jgi:predicted Zn-dependent protease
MNILRLLPIGQPDGQLQELEPALARIFRVRCQVLPQALDPEFAFHGERQQYHSSEILQRMRASCSQDTWRLLGVTGVDLYIPILTYVFGEAQVGGPCAVVSLHRLRQQFMDSPRTHGSNATASSRRRSTSWGTHLVSDTAITMSVLCPPRTQSSGLT